ncbi:ABC transporter substrate-binding protein [Alloscardovia venturai]|uniref:ABC transporter substrate-binding protein n=1 Tax=Alloscardovia venturai TaxID=1769421 RepID=A0ABW2Y9B5_9BIFI
MRQKKRGVRAHAKVDCSQIEAIAHSSDETLQAARGHSYAHTRFKHQKRHWCAAWAAILSVVFVLVAVTSAYTVWGKTDTSAGGEVSIGLQLAPTNLDIRHTSGTALDQLLIGNVYEALLTRKSNNTVAPGIAQSWEVSADRKTYTFHISRGLTFSNGDVLDARDVAWSISSMMSGKLQGSSLMTNYRSVAAVDSHTVVLTLSAPFSELLWNLSGRPGLVFDKDAHYDAKTSAVGSGPFVLTSYQPSVSVVLSARGGYKGTHTPLTKTIKITYYADPQAGLNALTSGDVQVLAPINSNLTAAIKNDSRFTYQAGEGTDKYVLAFNNAHGPLTDKRIRQAIRYAIDHKAIIASRGGTDTALGGPIPSLDPGYEDLTSLYPTDVARALKLMKEAGYDTSHPLKLRLTYANTYPAEIGQQLRSQLARIGIDLSVNRTEFATWLSQVYTNRDYDISLVDHNESHDFLQWANPKYYYGYDNKQVQKLYAQAMQADSDSQSDSLLKQAAHIVSEDAAADWLLNFRVVTAWDKRVTSFPLNLNQTWMPLWEVKINA